MSVLLNSKDGALTQAFQDNGKTSQVNQGFIELQRTLVTFIRGLPGNDKCCDCGSTNGKSDFFENRKFLLLSDLSLIVLHRVNKTFLVVLTREILVYSAVNNPTKTSFSSASSSLH